MIMELCIGPTCNPLKLQAHVIQQARAKLQSAYDADEAVDYPEG